MNKKQLNILDSLTEKQAERICRNIAAALQNPAFEFYESDGWLEIGVDQKGLKSITGRTIGNIGWYSLGLKLNNAFNKIKFKKLLKETIMKLLDLGIIEGFSVEKMFINLDLEGIPE